MIRKFGQLASAGLKGGLGLLGVGVYRKRRSTCVVPFDKYQLVSQYSENDKVRLYNEGLHRSHMEWSNSFLKQCRFYSLQQMVAYAVKQNPSGEFAECGCWKGHSTYIISKILADHRFSETFHVFDSFEGGLSDKDEQDRDARYQQSEEDDRTEKEVFASTEAEVRETVNEFDFVELYKGWIPDRFPEVNNQSFAFVHVDVDLYQPTLDSLNFFFPRLALRGVMVVDDYGYTHFPGAKKAVDEFLAANEVHLFYETPVGSCFIIK